MMLQTLEARLPELEWRMGALGPALSENLFPRGLFRSCPHPTPAFYIGEIKNDIKILASQESFQTADFLARRIQQKINVLTTVCHLQKQDIKVQRPLYAMASIISSRRQRVEALEADIAKLEIQERAMEAAHASLQVSGEKEALLKLQSELGLVKRELTLMREHLFKI